MERLKGVLLGLAVYLASVQLSRVTGINQWLYIIWSGSLIVAYGIVVEVKDKAEKKSNTLCSRCSDCNRYCYSDCHWICR